MFLTSQDPGFEEHIRDHYQGFAHCPVNELQPPDFHQTAKVSLERLRDANYYQYDVVMAGGKHSSRTFVKRCLVGNPGITYKYLGLRLFAHAWSGPGVTPLMKSIGDINQKMIRMTKQFPNHKKCDYNLTLINYMEPTIRSTVGFKEEANYGMGYVSILPFFLSIQDYQYRFWAFCNDVHFSFACGLAIERISRNVFTTSSFRFYWLIFVNHSFSFEYIFSFLVIILYSSLKTIHRKVSVSWHADSSLESGSSIGKAAHSCMSHVSKQRF